MKVTNEIRLKIVSSRIVQLEAERARQIERLKLQKRLLYIIDTQLADYWHEKAQMERLAVSLPIIKLL